MILGRLRSVAKLTKVTATLKLYIHVHKFGIMVQKIIRPIPFYSLDVEDHACLVQTPTKNHMINFFFCTKKCKNVPSL